MIHTQPETEKLSQKIKDTNNTSFLTLRASTALAKTWSRENVWGSRPDS
jgi:hypothetical protein